MLQPLTQVVSLEPTGVHGRRGADNGGVDALLIGDVQGESQYFAMRCSSHFRCGRLRTRVGQAGDHHVCAFCSKTLCDREPDAGSRAGDDGSFPL